MSVRRSTAISAVLALVAALLVALPTAAQAAPLPGPSSVRVTTIDGDLRLSWSAVPGAAGYTVEVSADPSFTTTLETSATYALTFVPGVTLAGGTDTLYWRVAAHERATTSASRGTWSTVESARPGLSTVTLSSPANGATIDYPAPVSFAWATVPGAIGYDLQYSSDPAFPTSGSTVTVEVDGTGYTPSEALARESDGLPITWHWRVRAKFFTADAAVQRVGPFSAARTFQVRWTAAASKPTLITPVEGTYVSDPFFEWSAVPGVKHYTLLVGTARSADQSRVENTFVNTQVAGTRYVHSSNLTDTNYFWQVIAHDLDGKPGTPSEVRQFRKQWGRQSGANLVAPFSTAYPVPLVGTNDIDNPEQVTFDELEFRWEPIPRATFYEVEVSRINPSSPALKCHTASTSATIIAKYFVEDQQNVDQLKGASDCLWSSKPTERISEGDLLKWRVRGIDYNGDSKTSLQSNIPPGTLMSQWSDPDSADYPGRERYIKVLPNPSGAPGLTPVTDAVAWGGETGPSDKQGQSAPLMTWGGLDVAVGYEVGVYLDEALTNEVAKFWTPQARIRANGVFANNQTDQPYRWNVRAISATDWSRQVEYPATGQSSLSLPWTRKAAPTDVVGIANPVDTKFGQTIIRWRPQFASAPGDGGSRGYQVTLRNSSNAQIGQPTKVEYPFWRAAHPQTGNPLPAGTGYRVQIAPLDANGEPGHFSTALEFDVAAPVPAKPTVRPLASGAQLSWEASGASEEFRITYQRTGDSAVTVPTGSTKYLQAGATLLDLPPGTYTARVSAKDKGNSWSTPSAAATWTVPNRAPQLVTPDNAVLPTSNRVVSWAPVDGASRYLVQFAATSGGLTSARPYETSATSFAVPDNVKFGTTYYWRVTAVGEKWTRTASLAARTVLGTSVEGRVTFRTVPGQVRLSRPSADNRKVSVSWTPLTGADVGSEAGVQYVVRYRLQATPERSWTTLGPTSTGATSQLVTVPSAGGTFEFQVAARNSEGQGLWSTSQTVSVTQPPTVPRAAKATAGKGRVTLKWTAPASDGGSPVTGYVVESRSKAPESKWSTWRRSTVRATIATSYTQKYTKLVPGTKYQYRIAAVTRHGTSASTKVLNATVKGAPGAPKAVKAKPRKGKTRITWKVAPKNGAKVTRYIVQRSFDGRKWKKVKAVKGKKRKLVTKVGKKGQAIHFRVVARNKFGKGTPSAAVRIVKR